MALVQLTVPGEDAPRRERRRVVGIDLGTTNSLVATVVDGKPEIIPGQDGRRLLRSVVDFAGDQPVEFGRKPDGDHSIRTTSRVTSPKRLLGLEYDDIPRDQNDRPMHPNDLVPNSTPVAIKLEEGISISPVRVSALILGELVHRAESSMDGRPDAAVITVPAYFDDAQRQATKDAAHIAGLEVLRLINEPTAAALAYGLDEGEPGIYVVYDMGGGTFDVSILRLEKGLFRVLATDGDARLGGDDFDHELAYKAVAELAWERKKKGQGLRAVRVPMRESQQAKEYLGSNESVMVPIDGTEVQITQSLFREATAELVKRSTDILRTCIDRAGVRDELKAVIMVGGSTRMPILREAVAAALPGVPLHTDLNPDEVVALGAAAQADILAGNRPANDWLLLDVNPLSLGIETMGGLVERIIPRNSPIPIARAQEFTTHKDGQAGMAIHVVQGERDQVADCRSLARFSLRGLPPMAAGTARVRVTYRLDADGLLSVSAREETTGTEAGVEVKPSYGLGEDEVTAMLVAAREHASADAGARALAEAKVGAGSLLDMLRTALVADAGLVGDDRPVIEQAIAALEQACAGDDVDAVRDATAALDRASEGFAARRMEAAMKSALAGRKVDDLAGGT